MLFGLTGASRSGKTTLARSVAEDLGIDFYETSTAKVAKELGYNAVSDLSLKDRLAFQTKLLEHHIEQIKALPRPLIVDRTPLDYMGYLTCEFTMASNTKADAATLQQAANFANACLKATSDFYDYIFYLAPLPTYKEEEGKHPENPIFQLHHAMVVQGGISQLKGAVNSALIFETDWDIRKEAVDNLIVDRLDTIDKERRTAKYLN